MGTSRMCVRCFAPRKASTTERLITGAGTYLLHLCEDHANLLQADLFGWTRCGILVEDHPTTVPASPRRAQPIAEPPGRGTIVASHIHFPVTQVPEPAEPATADPVPPRPRQAKSSGLPVGHEAWRFAQHALERSEERNVTRSEALWAALAPDTVQPSDSSGRRVHIRGQVKVVVHPEDKIIVTVAARKTLAQEPQHAAS